MSTYLWMDAKSETAPKLLAQRLNRLMEDRPNRGLLLHRLFCRIRFSPDKHRKEHPKRPIVYLCIGTPSIPGDSLGPAVGSLLTHNPGLHVFGTLEAPVHALNLRTTLADIKRQFHHPIIIVVDAALGNEFQNGFVAIKKGALKPGSGLGKRLPSIGDIQITGVFCNLYGSQAQEQMWRYSQCIAGGLAAFSS